MANGEERPVEEVEVTDLEVMDQAAPVMSSSELAEIDRQIVAAHRWPRSLTKFRKDVVVQATLDEETAASMFYVLPRDGKKIEGPSIRLAEVAVACWGNLRIGKRTIDTGPADRFVTGQGFCLDLERNISSTVEVRRRITNRAGRRYSEDMVHTTGLAAASIALRTAVFNVIPQAFLKPALEQAKKVSIGQALSLEQSRQRAVDWFGKLGVKPEVLLKMVGKARLEDLEADDLVTLRGVRTSLGDGELTVEGLIREVMGTSTVVTPGSLTPEDVSAGETRAVNGAEGPTPTHQEAPPADSDQPAEEAPPAVDAPTLTEDVIKSWEKAFRGAIAKVKLEGLWAMLGKTPGYQKATPAARERLQRVYKERLEVLTR